MQALGADWPGLECDVADEAVADAALEALRDGRTAVVEGEGGAPVGAGECAGGGGGKNAALAADGGHCRWC